MEYAGGAFSGWERQPARRTVQGELEAALARVAAHPVRVFCAGRTDSGVHALGQVVHFDTVARRPHRAWVLGVNSNLPADVSVQWAREVSPRFHARFTASSRHYRYLILAGGARPALHHGRVTWVHRRLDPVLMHEAAALLVGQHDFTSYRALSCQARSPVRTMHTLVVRRLGAFIAIDANANAFLHHMVRNIAGVLIDIGCGKQPVGWAREVLERRDRRLGGVTAPPDGLYLCRVDYPDEFRLPQMTLSASLW